MSLRALGATERALLKYARAVLLARAPLTERGRRGWMGEGGREGWRGGSVVYLKDKCQGIS